MGKWWDRDPRELTPLEWIHSPISPSRINSVRYDRPRAYQYYDTPEGQDIGKKMLVATKYGSGAGALFGLIDIKLYSNPATVLQTLNRFAYWVVPFTSMFTTFAAVSYTATNLRGKDDPLNSAIGGVAAGSLAGVWLKNGRVGFFAALGAGLFGACRKYSHDIGHELFNPMVISQMYGDFRTPRWDSSLTPIGNRGWTTGSK